MKKIVSALMFLLPLTAVAQQGSVVYEETVQMNIELPPEMEHMRDQIPSSQASSKVLYFNETSSLMKDVPRERNDTEIHSESGGMHVKMIMDQPENEVYSDLDNRTTVEKRDFMGRTFLIEGESRNLKWRFTDEKSEFLGYLCQKAVAQLDSSDVEAWFTPEIPVSAGPDVFGGLPGLILVVTVDDGQRSFVAKELSLDPLEEGVIAAPEKGRKVTSAEYEKIVDDKMKEMGAERGGNRVFQVKVRNN